MGVVFVGCDDQIYQPQKILDSKGGATCRKSDKRVVCGRIGPGKRDGDQTTLAVQTVHHRLSAPATTVGDNLELLPGQRMEGVRHPHSLSQLGHNGCNTSGRPSAVTTGIFVPHARRDAWLRPQLI
jgi:hypothetical protein